MIRRIPQPPLDPARRKSERHGFWPGGVLATLGAACVVVGALRSTGVDTVEDEPARETTLMKAFTSGGLVFAEQLEPPPPPPPTGDPVADAAALARWDKEVARTEPVSWRVRVDPSAKTPCPT